MNPSIDIEKHTPVSNNRELNNDDDIDAYDAAAQRGLGLHLTASLRSGVRPEELELEKPPDGGFEAWLQVAGAHITIFTTW
jgi:hypothetical protein